MNFCFLLKGFHYIENNDSLKNITITNNKLEYNFLNIAIFNFKENIYDILNNLFDKNIDFYFITYKSKIMNEFEKKLIELMPKFKIKYIDQRNDYLSVDLFLDGVKFINSFKKYDRYIFARNDMLYKISIDKWLPKLINKNVFWYLFKEMNYYDKRISDNIFIIDGDIKLFIDFLETCLQGKVLYNNDFEKIKQDMQIREITYNLHSSYDVAKLYYDHIYNIIPGVYDNDTQQPHIYSKNPIYKLDRLYYFDD